MSTTRSSTYQHFIRESRTRLCPQHDHQHTNISSERAEPDYVHNTIINIPTFHQREQNQIMSTTRSSTYQHFIRESRTRLCSQHDDQHTNISSERAEPDYVHNTIINSTIISSERVEPDYVHNTIINSTIISSERAEPDYVHNTIINSTIISSERAEPDYVHNTIINSTIISSERAEPDYVHNTIINSTIISSERAEPDYVHNTIINSTIISSERAEPDYVHNTIINSTIISSERAEPEKSKFIQTFVFHLPLCLSSHLYLSITDGRRLSKEDIGPQQSNNDLQNDFECHATNMLVHIPSSFAPNSKMYMRDSNCELVNNGSHFVITLAYDSCGTALTFSTDYMFARNDVTVHLVRDTASRMSERQEIAGIMRC
ncbi:hypothetical protein RRG08_038594 [Elysia crispata]|uniref:ZP domain-containing protein n=1 Tax=Elysia crispata TaxID=231223 RepID=A0AAE1ASA5_9GAST|nr:hypothetical protein RRG08_038594 [Elysia crispata]